MGCKAHQLYSNCLFIIVKFSLSSSINYDSISYILLSWWNGERLMFSMSHWFPLPLLQCAGTPAPARGRKKRGSVSFMTQTVACPWSRETHGSWCHLNSMSSAWCVSAGTGPSRFLKFSCDITATVINNGILRMSEICKKGKMAEIFLFSVLFLVCMWECFWHTYHLEVLVKVHGISLD